MPPFRAVAGGRAGPTAVGVLVPPGSRTLVVVRPRGLPLDLVLVRRDAGGFYEAGRQAAGLEAQRLTETMLRGESGRISLVPAGDGFHVRAEIGSFWLVACRRIPGEAYKPCNFATADDANETADAVYGVLCPPEDAEQELYTNLSQFERSPLGRGETS